MLLLAALAAALTAPVSAQGLHAQSTEREVPLSVAAEEEWSWHGLPTGRQEAWGVGYEMPTEPKATAEAVELEQPAALVYALVSPVVLGHLVSVEFEREGAEPVRLEIMDCALAWAATEPHSRRLLLARGEGPGITRVVPNGCYLHALVVGDEAAAKDEELEALYEQGRAEWRQRFVDEAPPVWKLQKVVDAIPESRIAILPPKGGEPAAMGMVFGRTLLDRKVVELEGRELLDAGGFSAERFPVAFHVGFERHLRTIKAPNDGQDALVRYLHEGGTMVVATAAPYPTYYAQDAGNPKPEPGQPIFPRLGIGIVGSFERPAEGQSFTMQPVEGQTVLPSLTETWPYPTTGDLRLRALGPSTDQAKMTPLVEVRDADGNVVGPAAALFELQPAGTLLYVSSPIMNDAARADGVMCDIVRWVAERLK